MILDLSLVLCSSQLALHIGPLLEGQKPIFFCLGNQLVQDESNNQTETHQDIFDEDKMLLEASLDAKDYFEHLKRMLGAFLVGILAISLMYAVILTFIVVP